MKGLFNRVKRRSGATFSPTRPNRDARRGEVPAQAKAKAKARTGVRPKQDRGVTQRITAYLRQHLQVALASLGQLSRSPLATLMTASVIAIALALPAGLYVVLKNAQQLAAGWDGGAQISLFLSPEFTDGQALQLAAQVRALPGVESVQVITRAQALREFRQLSGFGAALDGLDENPLPALLVVRPALGQAPAEGSGGLTADLLARLKPLPGVQLAQVDMEWLARLAALLAVLQRGLLILAALLVLAALLIVGNTIRLAIQGRRDEIEIIKLIGATDNFIQRPFLYNGLWYGLFGGIIAWGLVSLSLGLLQGPVQQLALLYHSNFALGGLDGLSSLLLVSAGFMLGLGGSALAVKRHLAAIEPV
ncbi:MAG TPA: permease-like cell division protein FtsX [Gammaproteobacteria bacterium]|nr:permease-like cell division protein FtsX [Gammaproteobacteria bacterium]